MITVQDFDRMEFKKGNSIKVVGVELFDGRFPEEFIGEYVWHMKGEKNTITLKLKDGRIPCIVFPLVSVEKVS